MTKVECDALIQRRHKMHSALVKASYDAISHYLPQY